MTGVDRMGETTATATGRPESPVAGDRRAGAPDGVSRLCTVAAHLAFPFGTVVSPLLYYFVPGSRDRRVREHSAAAFDFQLTYVFGFLIVVAAVSVAFSLTIGFDDGAVVTAAVLAMIFDVLLLFFAIRAAVDAWRGGRARYPASLRLLRRAADRRGDDGRLRPTRRPASPQ
jgi:uncharacterized Tic20 family protein